MKLITLFICSLVFTLNVSAQEDKIDNGVSSTAQLQAEQTSLGVIAQASVAESGATPQSHKHDVLKTQFFGKRPYMDADYSDGYCK